MRQGFSLVELSIVLVILGLLTGGVLAGKTLIRASELRAITSEQQRYFQALRAFQGKYFYFPGDMVNAVQFWGAQAGSTVDGYNATCAALDDTTPSTTTATCNGNGDGFITTAGASRYESFRAWQQLANAGLIEGAFTGVQGPQGTIDGVIGSNIPASRLSNVGWSVYAWSAAAATYWFDHPMGNFLTIGKDHSGNSYVQDGFLSTEEAWNLDTKMDDGLPGTGKVHAQKPASAYTPNCTTDADPTLARYNLNTTNTCSLFFFLS